MNKQLKTKPNTPPVDNSDARPNSSTSESSSTSKISNQTKGELFSRSEKTQE